MKTFLICLCLLLFGDAGNGIIVKPLTTYDEGGQRAVLMYLKEDRYSSDIPLDSNWLQPIGPKYTFPLYPLNLVSMLDDAFLKAFSGDKLKLMSSAKGNIGFVLTFDADGKAVGAAIKVPEDPAFAGISHKQWKNLLVLFKRINLPDSQSLSRIAFNYPSEWIKDLCDHLETGLPVDHYTHRGFGPDILLEHDRGQIDSF